MSESLKQALMRIYENRGTLTADIVVQEATDPSHPLHTRFEWDNTTAAQQWRLAQAGELIRSVKIKYSEHSDGTPKDLRAFLAVRIPESPRAVYMPAEEVAQDPMLTKIVLGQMRREWLAFKRRYEHLVEFAALVQEEAMGKTG